LPCGCSNWRTRYAEWPPLKKLEYADELMAEIAESRLNWKF